MATKKNKKTVKAAVLDQEQYTEKKSSMKTSADVISRLLWDESLPAEKFSVGYLDRFDGIIEKPFSDFDWQDPCIVDNYSLALPKHRIVYFKYLNRKVWDKRNRTDIVFGSTGHPISIHDFMSKVDNEILNFHDEDLESESILMKEITPMVPVLAENGSESEEELDVSGRPNFFIAARIKNETTVQNLKVVSDHIKSKDEVLGECCISPNILHLTLAILQLNSAEDISNAKAALQAVASKQSPLITIDLEGLDNFKHRVLYSKVVENKELLSLRLHLVDELVSRNVLITDRFSFVPHVTVIKLSRPVTKLRHSKYIDQYLYLRFEDDIFGSENIDKLYLCEMGASRREDGFYKCAFEMDL